MATRQRNRARDFLAERGSRVRHVAEFPALFGDHALLGLLGDGPRATTYRASTSGRSLALKIFDEGSAPDAAVLERFRRGSDAPIRHPSLPVIQDIGIHESGDLLGRFYYARLFLRGDSLEEILEAFELGRSEHPHLSPLAPGIDGEPRRGYHRQIAELFADVATGLSRAHEAGVCHGRIHPANLIFSPSGTLVLIDFEGDAQRENRRAPHDYLDPRTLYVAPERAGLLTGWRECEDDIDADIAADVYSLGAVLYQLVTHGSRRDRRQNLEARMEELATGVGTESLYSEDLFDDSELSTEFADVIQKALALDPADRYSSVAELRDDLRRLTQLEQTIAAGERFSRIVSTAAPGTMDVEEADTADEHFEDEQVADEEAADENIEVVAPTFEIGRVEDRSDEREVRAALLGAPETGRIHAELHPVSEQEETAEENVEEEHDELATDDPTEAPLPALDASEHDAVGETLDGLVADVVDDLAAEALETDRVPATPTDVAKQQEQTEAAVDESLELADWGIPEFDESGAPEQSSEEVDEAALGISETSPAVDVSEPLPAVDPTDTREVVAPNDDISFEERALLYGPAGRSAVGPAAEWRIHGQKILFSTVGFGVVMISILTWVSVSLHSASETHRQDGVRLGRVGNSITTALGAILREDSKQAVESLSLARGATRDEDRRRTLDAIEEHLRLLPEDALLARLQHPEPFVRLGALEQLREEVIVQQTRPRDNLVAATRLLWDDHVIVRGRSLEICADAGQYDAILASFAVGRSMPELTLDGETFSTLFDVLCRGALAAHLGASRAIAEFKVRELDGLDRFFASAVTSNDNPNGDVDGMAPPTYRLSPNLVIELSEADMPSFVKRWLNVHVELDSGAVVRELNFFKPRDDLMSTVISALERTDSRESRSTLRSLVRNRFLDYGRQSLAALSRLKDARTLLQIADEDLPLKLRLEALQKAVPVAGDKECALVARLLETHPEPRIRETAFAGLVDREYFAHHPTALVPALWDPFLRQRGLEYLAIMPPAVAAPSLPTLLDMVRSGDGELRLKVIGILGKTRAPELLLPLVRQLHESDPAVSRKTLEALAALGDDRAIPLAVGLIYRSQRDLHRRLMTMVSRLLAIPPESRREDPALVVLAIQELLEYENSGGENVGLRQIRRGALLSRLGPQFESRLDELLERIPPRIRDVESK